MQSVVLWRTKGCVSGPVRLLCRPATRLATATLTAACNNKRASQQAQTEERHGAKAIGAVRGVW